MIVAKGSPGISGTGMDEVRILGVRLYDAEVDGIGGTRRRRHRQYRLRYLPRGWVGQYKDMNRDDPSGGKRIA